ncbi:MAG: radical SAM protein [Candidatus Omnitrophota bacterium]
MDSFNPGFLKLSAQVFEDKIRQAKKHLTKCLLCPRKCAVDRFSGERGFCGAQADAEVAHAQLHFGEEPVLSASGGAGAIFFAHCNLKCVYCQNYQISQRREVSGSLTVAELAGRLIKLQFQGAQNIDFVSASHFAPQMIEAIYLAKNKGFCLPVVYNTNGYDSQETLELLSGIVDIYLPDFKYYEDQNAWKYSQVSDYAGVLMQALTLMYEQVGDLVIDDRGRAQSGVLLRHLVLPNRIAGSIAILELVAKAIGTKIGLSIMSQYHPCYQADRFAEINRTITDKEYDEVVNCACDLGFELCWIQEPASHQVYLPDFENPEVF